MPRASLLLKSKVPPAWDPHKFVVYRMGDGTRLLALVRGEDPPLGPIIGFVVNGHAYDSVLGVPKGTKSDTAKGAPGTWREPRDGEVVQDADGKWSLVEATAIRALEPK